MCETGGKENWTKVIDHINVYVVYYNQVNAAYFDDIMVTMDETGTAFTYDAWGKPTGMTGTKATTIGTLNPFWYRGYVYDTETGLYYLQSRYYDPEVGRFVNADAYVSTGQGITSYNMFAYCLNTPANLVDKSGEDAETAMGWLGSMWWMPLADTTLPIGDMIFAVGILFTILIPAETSAPPTAYLEEEKIETEVEAAVVTKRSDEPVIFPPNPNDFNPVGLKKVPKPGTYNGPFILWMDVLINTSIFRWDANCTKFDGPHYHIDGDPTHYYPGALVPEPYASIYFPFN